MPKFDVSKSDLEKLVGKKFSVKDLEDALLFAKTELDGHDGDTLKVDVKDTNRPDLWSAEGIARELKGHFKIEEGLPKYSVKKSGVKVEVDPKTKEVRPRVAAAVVRGLKFDRHSLSQLIQLQEKVAGTLGRNRKEVSIGVYDLRKIKAPIHFKLVDSKTKFIPLEFSKLMSMDEIIKEHPKGKQYGHLLAGSKGYPVLIDSSGEILSMAPIINSNYTGRVTEEVTDVFIDCTGFDDKKLLLAINVMCAALAERGGQIESVDVVYGKEVLAYPDLTPKKAHMDPDYCRKILGMEISDTEMIKLFKEARYNARLDQKKIHVEYPAYRNDIMHQRDLVEDVAIGFGYNDIKPETPSIPTVGSTDKLEDFTNVVRELCIGLGLQEVLTFILSNKENICKKMGLAEAVVEIENPISSNWSVFRSWLVPNLLEFLACNKNHDYPQVIFEVGDSVVFDSLNKETGVSNKRKLAVALTGVSAGYEDISSILSAFINNLGLNLVLKSTKHPSFIDGRAADIIVSNKKIGVIGEVHPQVLNNWNLEKAVVAFEIDIQEIFNSLEE